MATRLYFHNALNAQSGSYSQGLVYNTVGYGFAYGNGVYICHNGTQIQRSTNGIDWDDAISIGSNTNQINTLSFGNGNFMASPNDGSIWRSTDLGLTWSQVKAPVAATAPQNILYRGGWWFNCCDSATLMISNNDGTTWANATLTGIGGTATTYWVDYNSTSGQWVVVTGSTNSFWFTTNPAGSWTQGTGPATNSTIKTVIWNSNSSLWIVSLSQNSIYTTPTITATPTWTLRTVSGGGSTNTWCVNQTGSTVVIAGNQIVETSTDGGITWTQYNNTGLTPNMNGQIWYAMTWDGTYFWIFSAVGVIMRSTNGTTWRRAGGPLSNTVEFIGTTPLAIPSATAYKMRTMNTTIGTSQSSLSLTTSGQTTAQNNFVGFFVSETLNVNQTVGGGNIILNTADLEESLASNWWMNGLCVYVWRPSTAEVVGYIRDYQGVSLGGTEATAAGSEQVTHITGITSSAVNAVAGDVIVAEIWATATQGMATAYTNNFYFDGTTVNTTENAVVTSQASFIEFTENLTFGRPSTANMLLLFY